MFNIDENQSLILKSMTYPIRGNFVRAQRLSLFEYVSLFENSLLRGYTIPLKLIKSNENLQHYF